MDNKKSREALKKLVSYLEIKRKDDWVGVSSVEKMSGTTEKYFLNLENSRSGKGTCGKENYIWLPIKYKDSYYVISTVGYDVAVAADYCNIHHYFGQIWFYAAYAHSDFLYLNKKTTTVRDMKAGCDDFENFIKGKGFKTMRQKNDNRELTAENIVNGTIEPYEVIDLFEKWVERIKPAKKVVAN